MLMSMSTGKRAVKRPAQMKLLIVVNKLLTGFDAPCATILYIDNEIKDHTLFQAVCRVNRLGEDIKDDKGDMTSRLTKNLDALLISRIFSTA